MNTEELYQLFKQYPNISTDTRNIKPDSIFFALKGQNFNANKFADEAIKKGAKFSVIDDNNFKLDDQFIVVDDTLKSLQQLAAHHRLQLKIPVIAIAGSNGKTTTKELMTSVLSAKYKVLSTSGNLNNHIGLPLTILQISALHEMAIIEMGANHCGENEFLCRIALPNFGIVTNNGKDHLEGFGDIEGVIKSNKELYDYLSENKGIAFVNAHDNLLMNMASGLENKKTYAANFDEQETKADYIGFARKLRPQIKFAICNSQVEMSSTLSGDYNFDNIMAAVSFGLFFGLSEEEIKLGIETYEPKNNRSQIVKTKNNTIYLDAYNANPSSVEASLLNFSAMSFEDKIIVLGDMFELGKFAEQEHQAIVELCEKLKLENVFLIGEEFYKTKNNFMCFNTTNELMVYLKSKPIQHKNIFVKGSRGMHLEALLNVF